MDLIERDATGAILGSVLVAGLVLAVMIPGCPLKEDHGAGAGGHGEGTVETGAGAPEEFAGSIDVIPPEYDAEGAIARIERTDAEWRHLLTPEQYGIVRRKGTERPFCGNLLDNKKEGIYACVACGLPLFRSDAKFVSGTGWPSFFRPVDRRHIQELRDTSHGMARTEILCARCDAHLGHVFEDGPRPTGHRYCVNSESLRFVETPNPE